MRSQPTTDLLQDNRTVQLHSAFVYKPLALIIDDTIIFFLFTIIVILLFSVHVISFVF